MTRIEIDAETLLVRVQGLDKLWAFKSELRIPLAHISGVARAAEQARKKSLSIRAPGTHVPGLITAGTYHTPEGKAFWDVRTADHAIAITLRDDRYVKLVIDVNDPAAEIGRIEAAVAAHAAVV